MTGDGGGAGNGDDDTDGARSVYEPGTRVYDRDQDAAERTAAVVIRVCADTAEHHEIDALARTVADVNPEYPPDDPVVQVAFVSDLDGTVPGWHRGLDDGDSLDDHIQDFTRAWGVSIRYYSYPASRLAVVPACPDCGEPQTWVHEPMVSGVVGWFCHNDDCPRDM